MYDALAWIAVALVVTLRIIWTVRGVRWKRRASALQRLLAGEIHLKGYPWGPVHAGSRYVLRHGDLVYELSVSGDGGGDVAALRVLPCADYAKWFEAASEDQPPIAAGLIGRARELPAALVARLGGADDVGLAAAALRDGAGTRRLVDPVSGDALRWEVSGGWVIARGAGVGAGAGASAGVDAQTEACDGAAAWAFIARALLHGAAVDHHGGGGAGPPSGPPGPPMNIGRRIAR